MSNQEFSGLGLNHTLYILKKDQEEGEWIDGENCEEERWIRDFPSDSVVKNLPAVQEMCIQSLGQKIP